MSGLDLDALEAQALAGDLQPHGRARLGDPMTRAKPGRPPGPPGSQRTALLRVRVSDAEREAYQAAARRAGVSVGEWVRTELADAIDDGPRLSESDES